MLNKRYSPKSFAILTLIAICTLISPFFASAQEFKVQRILPANSDHQIPNQLVIEFNRPVVPLGRMERSNDEITIQIEPKLICNWRWINPTTLACITSTESAPLAATTYTITIPKLFDRSGSASLATDVQHSFTTARPRITAAWFLNWSDPGLPTLSIQTNHPTLKESLAAHLILDANGVAKEFAIDEKLIEPGSGISPTEAGLKKGTQWLLTPKHELPLNTEIKLRVTPGLVSPVGAAIGIENRQIIKFTTFPSFDFLGVVCRNLADKEVLIAPADLNNTLTYKTPAGKRCDPLNAIQLAFNAPVSKDELKKALTSQPAIKGSSIETDPWEDVYSRSRLSEAHYKNQRYLVNLPYGLKANTPYSLMAPSNLVRDQFNRSLKKDLAISFLTDHRAPRYVLNNEISVLEKDTDSQLPLIVNNIDSVRISYQSLTTDKVQSSLSKEYTPYRATDLAYAFPIDVRSLLGGRSGIVQGKISTIPKTTAGEQWFLSQVTPYAVHIKLGHFSSLAWVTSMSTGKPIQGAQVSIGLDTIMRLSQTPQVLTTATTDESGIAHLEGTHVIDPKLLYTRQWERTKPQLLARVEKDGELAVVPLTWDFQVYDQEIYGFARQQYGHIRTWGTTAQALYKAGDTVQFSVWARDQNDTGLRPAPTDGYKLTVTDPTDKVIYEVDNLSLSEFGSYHGEFQTDKESAVGWYNFKLTASFSEQSWNPLRILISDFTPAPFKVSSELRGTNAGELLFKEGDTVNLSTAAQLHAGGPYTEAGLRVSARIRASEIKSQEPKTTGYYFQSDLESEEDIHQANGNLSMLGEYSTSFTIPTTKVSYGYLLVESAVQDDRGKYVTSVSKARYAGAERFIGIAQSEWLLSVGKESETRAIVINQHGALTQGEPIAVSIEREETKAARVKSGGNAYITQYSSVWNPIKTCDLSSSINGASCRFIPDAPGKYRLTAVVKDFKGREHRSSITRWATGSGDVVWSSGTNNQIDIVSEKSEYKLGETARLMIQNPFSESLALLTIERYGIKRSWTQVLRDNTAVIEIPITEDLLPGFFFSATITSPRINKPIDNQVDLGKPTFRMGYVQIKVSNPAKRLEIGVTPQAQLYKPQDTVTIDIQTLNHGTSRPEDIEYAVTVLDEGVFDLIRQGREYFDPYEGFYRLEDLDVHNFNLLKMIIGRQKFEKKGANPGGDGGSKLDMRSLKKFIAYWNPSVRADSNGKASISFKAPDNLTGWKVFVIGFTKTDRMGLGEAGFKTNKSIEVRSALPNQVLQGDAFNAVFTVMNRSEATRTISVDVAQEGDATTTQSQQFTIQAEPFKRYPIEIRTQAIKPGNARFIIRASDATSQDSLNQDNLVTTLSVLPRLAPRVAASFGSSTTPITEILAIPKEIQPGSAAIKIALSSTIIGGLERAFEYMKSYPFECWEQKISKAVAAAHALSLRRYLPRSFEWLDADKVVRETLASAAAAQAPNGGMSFYLPSDEHSNPFLSAFTALSFSWLKEQGYAPPTPISEKLDQYLLALLRRDSFPSFYSPGMKADVRAVAIAALASNRLIKIQDINRFIESSGTLSTFSKALLLQALSTLESHPKLIRAAAHRLLSEGAQTNSTFLFNQSESLNDHRILGSEMRTQCAALTALISAVSYDSTLKNLVVKAANAVTKSRKRSLGWENTQENAFCLNAIARFSSLYESGVDTVNLAIQFNQEQIREVSLKARSADSSQSTDQPEFVEELNYLLKQDDSGSHKEIKITPHNNGRFYYSTKLMYSPLELPVTGSDSGIKVSREYSVKRGTKWSLLHNPAVLKRGEVVKVDLFLEISAPRYYVVLEDPIPGGFEPINRDLATTSEVDSAPGSFIGPNESQWFSAADWNESDGSQNAFYHRELRNSSARFYSEYLPRGRYHLSYTTQAIASGEFTSLPAHAEEMYNTEVSGETPAAKLRIE